MGMERRVALVLAGAITGDAWAAAQDEADRADVTLSLALDAEAWTALARGRPAALEALREDVVAGRVHLLLTPAHGGEPALMTPVELADELRLSEELAQQLTGVALERRGLAGSADPEVLEQAGIDFVLAPSSATPRRVGGRLLAIPARVLDAATLDAGAVENAVEELREAGAVIVGAHTLAADLTPPWLSEGAVEVPSVPAAAQALATLTGWCTDAFGLPRVPGVAAAALVEEGWRLDRFPTRARLPLARRRGLGATRRAWVAAFEVCDALAVEARVPGSPPQPAGPIDPAVLPLLRTLAEAHGAGEPMARAEADYEELRAFRFHGATRWRAFLSSLRDTFALLASRREVDWGAAELPPLPVVEDVPTTPYLRVVDSGAILN